MASLRTAGRIALLALVALAVGATATQADPSDDFEAVYVDWVSDEDITDCRFARQQLVNAAIIGAAAQQVNAYDPGFAGEVRPEIARHDFGGCPRPARPNDPRAGSRLRAVHNPPQGRGRRERDHPQQRPADREPRQGDAA